MPLPLRADKDTPLPQPSPPHLRRVVLVMALGVMLGSGAGASRAREEEGECGGHEWQEDCEAECSLRGRRANGSEAALPCRPERCTQLCVAQFGGPVSGELPPCGQRLHFQPTALPDQHGMPSVDLHLRLVLDRTNVPEGPVNASEGAERSPELWLPGAVKLELDCVFEDESSSGDQCLHASKSSKNLSFWPCRSFDFHSAELRPVLPAQLSYDCFRVAPRNRLRVNVTLFALGQPRCRNSYYFKIPPTASLGPEEGSAWLPTGFVDVSPLDGVWVRWTAAPARLPSQPSGFLVSLKDSAHLLLLNQTLPANKTGFRFQGLRVGKYVAEIRPLFPPAAARSLGGGMLQVLFFVAEAKVSRDSGSFSHIIRDGLPWVVAALALGIIAILVVVVCAVLRKMRRRDGERDGALVELRERPKLMLVYADDHPAQRALVGNLARFLSERANCEVLFDEWELSVSAQPPDAWYLASLAAASRTLVLLTPAALAALQGHRLVNDRPWVDMFPTLLHSLLHRVREELGARPPTSSKPLQSVAWLSLQHHALSLPPQLRHLPILHHRLPAHLPALVAQLHGVDPATLSHSEDLADAELRSAVATAAAWEAAHPQWLAAKLSQAHLGPDPAAQLQRLPRQEDAGEAEEEPREANGAEHLFPLLPKPAEEDGDGAAHSHFPLLQPPDEDDEDD